MSTVFSETACEAYLCVIHVDLGLTGSLGLISFAANLTTISKAELFAGSLKYEKQ
jgi:hypothetical protein